MLQQVNGLEEDYMIEPWKHRTKAIKSLGINDTIEIAWEINSQALISTCRSRGQNL